MSPKITKRGFHPNDHKWFSAKALEQLRLAQQEIQWLLDRHYGPESVIRLVCDHHMLSSRQRVALQRATSSNLQYKKRRLSMLSLEAAKDGCLYVDGFNLIITLEVALSGSLLVLGNDGVIRDLAGLRGTYRIIAQTELALVYLGKYLSKLSAPKVHFYLDAPVSNSRNLRNRILKASEKWGMPVEVELTPNADSILATRERIVTGDSVLLDTCKSWFNLSRGIIENYIPDAWIVSFNNDNESADTL